MTKMSRWITGKDNYLYLSVIFGIVTTLLSYAGFGGGDHIEQLPIIIRSLDSNFLQNDFFVNATADSIVRLHYTALVATLAGSEKYLPLVFLVLTLATNIAISVITYYFARDLFKSSTIAGLYASALVMSISAFQLGAGTAALYATSLLPSSLAIPFILGAIWLVARGKIVIGIVSSGIASLVHPLFGLEIAGVLLIAVVISYFADGHYRSKEKQKAIVISLVIFAIFSLISIFPHFSRPNIDSGLFIHILAYFRHPHHYVPSQFGLGQWIYAIAFLSAVGLFYYRSQESLDRKFRASITMVSVTILTPCIGGIVFVEILPMRIWVTAQTFRLLFVIKWFGLMLIAGTLANRSLPGSSRVLYLGSLLNPLSLAVAALSQPLLERFDRKPNWFRKFLFPSLIVLIIVAIYSWRTIPLLSASLLSLYLILVLAASAFRGQLFNTAYPTGMVLLLALVLNGDRLPFVGPIAPRGESRSYYEIRSELDRDAVKIADFARNNTLEESVFLTPPGWGQFRIVARRAIIVDFKAFPFEDIAVAEWHDRILYCYGTPTERGFPMMAELDKNYRTIDDGTLSDIQQKYNIGFAVLNSQTATNFEVVFHNRKYKVVRLGEK